VAPQGDDARDATVWGELQKDSVTVDFGKQLILGSQKIINSCDGHATA
jgi:hypothetical protein